MSAALLYHPELNEIMLVFHETKAPGILLECTTPIGWLYIGEFFE